MIIPIIIFFGSILFGFGILYLAIRFWRRKQQIGNQNARQFSQSYGSVGGVLTNYDDDSDIEDYSDYSNLSLSSQTDEKLVGAVGEMSGDLATSNNDTTSESSWSYNSAESSSSSSDSSSWSSCSSSSSDSSSSCSSGSSCSSSSSSD